MSAQLKSQLAFYAVVMIVGLAAVGCSKPGISGGTTSPQRGELSQQPRDQHKGDEPPVKIQPSQPADKEPTFEGKPLSQWIVELDSANVEQRKEALRALSAIGPAAQIAIPKVRKLLQDPDADVQEWACAVLGRIGDAAKVAVPDLEKIVLNPGATDKVRWAAAVALGNIGPSAVSATPTLLKALRDGDPWLRWAATEGLSGVGPEAKGAAKALAEALYDSEYVVRIGAARALVHLAPQVQAQPKVLSALIRCYEDTSQFDTVRQKVAEAIKAADPKLAIKLGIK